MNVSSKDLDRIITALERLADAGERSATISERAITLSEEVLTYWRAREQRELDAIAERDLADLIKAEAARTALAQWDLAKAKAPR